MKLKILITLILLTAAIKATARDQDSLKYLVISPAEFLQKYQSSPGALMIDVRDRKDFNRARITGALNIPYTDFDVNVSENGTVIPDKPVFIYCYAGFRSRKAAIMFYNWGYRKIYSLEGGFINWKQKKMPVEKGRLKRPAPQ
jgi:rhodanese-related sulfurtransferase